MALYDYLFCLLMPYSEELPILTDILEAHSVIDNALNFYKNDPLLWNFLG